MPTQVAVIKKNYAGTAHVFQAATAVVLIAAGVYGYFQYQKLSDAQAALQEEQTRVVSVHSNSDDAGRVYDALKKQSDTSQTDILNKVQAVFPADENYTGLTVMLDNYFKENDKPDNEIFNSSLSFGQPVADPKSDYGYLPFSMNITATRDNFDKFLNYIFTSGDMEGSVRLMDIKNISLQLPSINANAGQTAPGASTSATQSANELNVSLTMDAYYQKPVAGSSNKNSTGQ